MVHHHRSPTMEPNKLVFLLQLPLFLSLLAVAYSATDPNDLAILNQFKKGLKNPELLNWPANDADPCGSTTKWNNTVFCSGNRVTQIQVQGYGLSGPLPQNLNQLSMLQNVGFQKNLFTGALPSFSGLTHLQYAYLDYNQFDTIPADFFNGLSSLEVLALDYINLNASTGWMFPTQLGDAAQLRNLSCMKCNLVGTLPSFLGNLSSLSNLKLSFNNLSGEIPASFNNHMSLQMFWLNNQQGGGGLTGPIDVVTTMSPLNSLWLHGNQFTGTIPESIGDLTLLKDLNLNGNKLVGLIPDSLANLALDTLDLSNNMLMGPIPKFKAKTVAFASNMFCQTTQGLPCAPAVVALIEFLGGLNYPSRLVSSWTGNDPCGGPWLGLSCSSGTEVNNINMPNFTLSGTLSPAVARLGSLIQIRLQNNNLSGPIPGNWTSLKYLTSLDLSGNNISPPLPSFNSTVKLNLVGNLLLNGDQSPPSGNTPSSGGSQSPSNNPSGSNGNGTSNVTKKPNSSKRSILVSVVAPVASVAVVAFLAVPLSVYFCKKRKDNPQAPSSVVIHPRDPSDLDNTVKIVVTNNTNGSTSAITGSGSGSRNSSGMGESHVIESGNLIISVQVLRNVTKNFSSENELGRGGFGVVYKGELDDGTKIAVKRMEAGIITNKALDEFQSEIAVLSKVRHRHLVSLLGYSIEGNERILVYEYMPQGALMTGKITTKADVFSFGVVLMELLTGLMALDEDRPEETQYLAAWFWHIKSDQEKLMAAIDPALDINEETLDSISTIADLAGHCTAREPGQRPDMGHAVNVLAPLVEKWKPFDDDNEEYSGIDYSLPLNQMVKGWQEGKDLSYMALEDSKDSIPARPAGFAESFTSADGR
ncbi:receptor-like kinase tmk3 [Quercus suber]|uniref:Receptor-like kinase tmk3 n=1 Tax=Quercus suber TaxID=58331 RepID=A0AAW0M2Y5_QUESU